MGTRAELERGVRCGEVWRGKEEVGRWVQERSWRDRTHGLDRSVFGRGRIVAVSPAASLIATTLLPTHESSFT
jgi:hypothetical protein